MRRAPGGRPASRGASLALTTGDRGADDAPRHRLSLRHDDSRRTRDLRRFQHPRDWMGYLGLVPSEHSSGPTQHRGQLTRTGNTHVRRILIEPAWNYRFAARIGESLQPRLEGQPQDIVAIAWKAQVRLCSRFRRLRARGVHHNKVTAAIARELCGFIWDIGRGVPMSGTS